MKSSTKASLESEGNLLSTEFSAPSISVGWSENLERRIWGFLVNVLGYLTMSLVTESCYIMVVDTRPSAT